MDDVLKKLVSIPSICGDTDPAREIINYAGNFLAQRKMTVNYYETEGFPSLVATTRPTKHPRVMLVSHLDIVAGPPELFDLRLENGLYYGRGVWDMKCAAAIYLRLADELQHTLSEYDFGIMLTTDEETYGEYGTGMLLETEGYSADVAILPDAIEPWRLQEFAKGAMFAKITTPGVSAHGSRPWEGDSASFKLLDILGQVKQMFAGLQKPETATLNIGAINCGNLSMYNQIPNSAIATLDIRYLNEPQIENIQSKIHQICEPYNAVFEKLGSLRWATHNDLSDPHIALFADIAAQIRGVEPQPTRANGTSDARFFTKHNIPCILSSPKGGGFHGNDEWLDAEDYEQFKQIIAQYLQQAALVK